MKITFFQTIIFVLFYSHIRPIYFRILHNSETCFYKKPNPDFDLRISFSQTSVVADAQYQLDYYQDNKLIESIVDSKITNIELHEQIVIKFCLKSLVEDENVLNPNFADKTKHYKLQRLISKSINELSEIQFKTQQLQFVEQTHEIYQNQLWNDIKYITFGKIFVTIVMCVVQFQVMTNQFKRGRIQV